MVQHEKDLGATIAPDSAMERLQQLALSIGNTMSKDPNTKVACLLLDGETSNPLSIGWNSFPDGVDDSKPERWHRPSKYRFVCHAETNAIAKAARNGIRLQGASCIIPIHPCTDCAKALIQAGIKKVMTQRPDFDHVNWGDDWRFAVTLLREAGVAVTYT